MPEVVLFDLDGTLTDSAPGMLASIQYAVDTLGLPQPTRDELRSFLGPPLAVSFGQTLGLSAADVTQAIAAYRERYHDVGLFESSVYPGIPEALEVLSGRGLVLAVATSKPTVSATRILEHFGMAESFAWIGGALLDRSRDSKAAVIAHVLEELDRLGMRQLDQSIAMIGDREHDVVGARAHGIDTIGVLWGYGSEAELVAAGAVGLAYHPGELVEQIAAFMR